MLPLVTIAIPTYDRLHYLRESVASALAQTYENIEILIGNDGTVSALQQWCTQKAKEHSQIRYQKNDRNLGLAGNWNKLADNARGELITIIGDDDRLLPDFVSKSVEAMNAGASLVFSNHFVINGTGERLPNQTKEFTRKYGRASLQSGLVREAQKCAWSNSIPISTTLLRAADVRRLRFKEDLTNPEVEFFVRLAAEGGKFAFNSEFLVEYRVHPKSATASMGLTSHRLVDYLLDIPVHSELEPDKAKLLASLMVNAVSESLLAGDYALAKRLLASRYYPEHGRATARRVIQRVCCAIPMAGHQLYRLVHAVKQVLNGHRPA
jgi:glycosyltransferase involved in cell wall biosynthesis